MPTSNIHIINARTEHLPIITQIEREAASVYPPGILPSYLLSKMIPHKELVEGIVNDSLFIALTDNARVQGFILVHHFPELALLTKVDVRPQVMRRGVGTQLINTVLEKLPSWGHSSLWLTTFGHLPWTAPLYEKFGFSRIEQTKQPTIIQQLLAEEVNNGLLNRIAMQFSLDGQAK